MERREDPAECRRAKQVQWRALLVATTGLRLWLQESDNVTGQDMAAEVRLAVGAEHCFVTALQCGIALEFGPFNVARMASTCLDSALRGCATHPLTTQVRVGVAVPRGADSSELGPGMVGKLGPGTVLYDPCLQPARYRNSCCSRVYVFIIMHFGHPLSNTERFSEVVSSIQRAGWSHVQLSPMWGPSG